MSFIVVEGLDGSGKSTQMGFLRAYLDAMKKPYRYLHFPRLEEGVYGKLIARFLRGEMGAINQVDPYLVALIFAGDRAEASDIIGGWIKNKHIVILDRYVYSNIAFQCAKIPDPGERSRLRDWILNLEFEVNKIPKPDLNLFLDVPIEFVHAQLKSHREGSDRDYLKGCRDIHEDSLRFQETVREVYLSLPSRVDDLKVINCQNPGGEMKPAGQIFELIKKQITGLL
ncbi:MAG: dTMP kinase [Bacteroidales bacterium]|nr:dTMP kinase [Bacteroidales bacterium]MBN2697265.1 dTMP kinase [Bacteroidales bacterium]